MLETCTSNCKRAMPGHCACTCNGKNHGALAPVQQLPLLSPQEQLFPSTSAASMEAPDPWAAWPTTA